ncbi:MAG: cytochrome c peroxidase [Pseudomonadota bacterium]
MRYPVFAAAIAASALASCSGGGTTTGGGTVVAASVTPTPTPAVVTPTPTPTPTSAVTIVTTLDLAALASYAPVLPAYYDATVSGDDNTPAGTALDNRIATLGRVLFYDRRLSTNDTISCSSCHQQASGFTDPRRFSTGVNGAAFTTAHSMRLGNVRYWRPASMFWDRRAATLEAQASGPITNPVEMGWDAGAGGVAALITKMNGVAYYPELFTFAFGSATITEARIQQALAMFQRAMVSTNSRWDTGYAAVFGAALPNRGVNLDLANFTAQENRGRALFFAAPNAPGGGGGCSACHQAPTFGLDQNSRSNGLDAGETILFKSPSLKNAGLTGPYMHDGRFATLAAVIEHYDSGVLNGPALDNRLRPGGVPIRLNLSAADKAALVAFLLTLNDPTLTTDVKFSTPFRP